MLATAANLPSELFPRILEYVGTTHIGWGDFETRRIGDGLRDLKSCSRVCVDWANRCREVILEEVCIRSQEGMKALGYYAKHGSQRLMRTPSLIDRWRLEQTWASHSWCHARYSSSFSAMSPDSDDSHADGLSLTLCGPVPASLALSALHSLHWSLPRSMPACYTPFTWLHLKDIHFPLLSGLLRLLRHFKCLRVLKLETITWDGDNVNNVSPVARVPADNLYVTAEGCTDNTRVCSLTQLIHGSGSPFQRLRAQERDSCLVLLHPASPEHPSMYDFDEPTNGVPDNGASRFVSREVSIRCPSSSLLRISHNLLYTRAKAKLLYLEAYALTVPAVGPLPSSHIVALLLSLRADMTFSSFRLASLKSCVEQMPSLRLLVLLFERKLSKVDDMTRSDPALRSPLSIPGHAQVTYRFLSDRPDKSAFADVPVVYEDDLVEINPVTCQPTGQTWDGDYFKRATLVERMMKKYHPARVEELFSGLRLLGHSVSPRPFLLAMDLCALPGGDAIFGLFRKVRKHALSSAGESVTGLETRADVDFTVVVSHAPWILFSIKAGRGYSHARWPSLDIKRACSVLTTALGVALAKLEPPRSMPVCSAVFVTLELKNIHFPSLSSLSKLLRQFRSLQRISLETITWGQDETMHIAPVLFPRISKLTASARACTDNLHIARQAYDTLCSGSSFNLLPSTVAAAMDRPTSLLARCGYLLHETVSLSESRRGRKSCSS